MLKRILSLLITLAMCAGMVTIPAMAEGEGTVLAPVFYEGEEIFSQDFSSETDDDGDDAKFYGLTIKNSTAVVEGGKLKLTYSSEDMANTTGYVQYNLPSGKTWYPKTIDTETGIVSGGGKYAIEMQLSMTNTESTAPMRTLVNLRGKLTTDPNKSKSIDSLGYVGTSGGTSKWMSLGGWNSYEETSNNKEYNLKFVIDLDNMQYYIYVNGERFTTDTKEVFALNANAEYYTYMYLINQNKDTATGGTYEMTNTLDDIRIYRVYTEDELSPFTLTSSTIENGATEILAGAGSVDLTFSNKVDPETIKYAKIEGLDVTPALSEDGKTLTLSWSALEYGKTYNVDLTELKDVFYQSFSGEAISFTATSEPPVFIEVDEIYAQNFDGNDVTVENCGLTIPDNTTATIQNGKLNLAYDSKVFTSDTSIVQYGGLNWATGKYAVELKVSMTNGDSYPRRVIGNLRSGRSSVIQGAYTGNHTTTNSKALYVDKINQGNVVNGQEYAFKFVYDMDNNLCYSYLDGELITKEGRVFDKADAAGTLIFLLQQNIDGYKVDDKYVYGDFKMTNTIDDIRIYEVCREGEMPEFKLTSSTIENNAEDMSSEAGEVKLTFSNKLESATIANAVIRGGAENPVVIPALDETGKILTLAWEEALEPDTTYTVDFSGVEDTLGQSLADGIIYFTTKTDFVRSGDYIFEQDFNSETDNDGDDTKFYGLKISNATTEITSDGKLKMTYSSGMGRSDVQYNLPSDKYWYPKKTDAETGEVTGGGKFAIEMTLSMTNDDITIPYRGLVNLRGLLGDKAASSINTLATVGTSSGTTNKTVYMAGKAYEELVYNKEYRMKFIVDMDNMKYHIYVNDEKFTTESADSFNLNSSAGYISYMHLLQQNPEQVKTGAYAMTNTFDDIYIYPVELVEHNAPAMVSSTPAANATDVSEETNVQITFDEAIDLDSVNNSTLYITGSDVNILEKTLSEDKKTLTVSFDDDLTFETEQTVTVNGIRSIYGKAMSEASFKFTTCKGYLKVTDNEFTIDGSKADVLKKGTLKAVRKVSNFSDQDYTATLILALYKGKELADVKSYKNLTIFEGKKGELKGELTIPELTGDETYTVKAMLWSSVQGMIPLENPAELSNK